MHGRDWTRVHERKSAPLLVANNAGTFADSKTSVTVVGHNSNVNDGNSVGAVSSKKKKKRRKRVRNNTVASSFTATAAADVHVASNNANNGETQQPRHQSDDELKSELQRVRAELESKSALVDEQR